MTRSLVALAALTTSVRLFPPAAAQAAARATKPSTAVAIRESTTSIEVWGSSVLACSLGLVDGAELRRDSNTEDAPGLLASFAVGVKAFPG